jgi:glycosyltransferase involved in cell wall biosynthesis
VPSRPRIVQVLYSGLGGHAAVAFPLIEAGGLGDPWEHQLIFYGIEPVAPGYLSLCSRFGVPNAYVPACQGRPWGSWPSLIAAIRQARPDAVILHSIKTVIPARLATIGRPLIAVEHQANALKSRAEWGASVTAQLLADRVVTLSSDYRAGLARRLGPFFRPARNALVPTGIDLASFAEAGAAAIPKGPVRIGMAGRFSPTKAQEVLVATLAHLCADHPERDWRLSLAGDGTRFPAVFEAVRAAGLQERVVMEGHIAPEQLSAWFATLDLYAHASDGETLSTALLQAMAAGVPIVASDVPGISDLLGATVPGEASRGRLVPARDAHAFAQAIAEDVADPAAAAARAARARTHVLRHHSPQAMRAGYASLLESLP